MSDEAKAIDEQHRKELLKFLLVKTAAVRRGVKPGELLRVRHCYEGLNAEGLRVCLYRSDIYEILGLDYIELKVEEGSSLVLFYNPTVLAATLKLRANRKWLRLRGYPSDGTLQDMLRELVARATTCDLPHEVGIFIGYPLKDVAGFVHNIPATPIHRGAWRVCGGLGDSLARMKAYAAEERAANAVYRRSDGVGDFIARLAGDVRRSA